MIAERKLPICESCQHGRPVVTEKTFYADCVKKEIVVQCEAIDDCARAYSMGLYDGWKRRDDEERVSGE